MASLAAAAAASSSPPPPPLPPPLPAPLASLPLGDQENVPPSSSSYSAHPLDWQATAQQRRLARRQAETVRVAILSQIDYLLDEIDSSHQHIDALEAEVYQLRKDHVAAGSAMLSVLRASPAGGQAPAPAAAAAAALPAAAKRARN